MSLSWRQPGKFNSDPDHRRNKGHSLDRLCWIHRRCMRDPRLLRRKSELVSGCSAFPYYEQHGDPRVYRTRVRQLPSGVLDNDL